MWADFFDYAPLASLADQCYFCTSKTPYIYKRVRLCFRHAGAEVKAVIDVQNAHLHTESKSERDILNHWS